MSNCVVDWLFDNLLPRTRPRRIRRAQPIAVQLELLESRILLSIDLGVAETFAVLAGQSITNTGPTAIDGDVGVSPGSSVTGFPPGTVTNGTMHLGDAVALQAQSDLVIAYNEVAGKAPTVDLTGQDLGGMTLTPGVYFFSTSAQLTGTLTLDSQGDPNAEFDFQIGSTLTTASNSSVVMINGGDACDVYWQVGSSATLGTNTAFVGHILAMETITLNTGASVDGAALARNGSVTLDNNVIIVAACIEGSIAGTKFNDINGDGVRQVGEPGLGGITVFLDTNNNGLLDGGETSTVTDVNGDYLFDELLAGTYLVRQMLAPGIVQTTPNPPDVVLEVNEDVTDVDFGDFFLVTIDGTKFEDLNGNRARNPGEPGIEGVTVFLDTNNNGVLDIGERSTTTDVDGNYSFDNVGPGSYFVREVLPVGFVQSTSNPATIDTSSGTNVSGVLFGNFELITIGGTKFEDTNGNGVQDPGELGLQGFTIFLDANNNGTFDVGERLTTTDANGNYVFLNVGIGVYRVREVQQPGFTQTSINPAPIFTVSGSDVAGVSFGNFEMVTIDGTKFEDLNGNRARNPGEPGIEGVTVFLDTNNNGVLDIGERSTTTDINGNYSFDNVGPGSYFVREVLPVGFVRSTVIAPTIVNSSGTNVSGVLIGNFELITIGGTKFEDTNGNGVQDAGETGLAGVTIFLDANNNGTFDVGERLTTTDANGNYVFLNVGIGVYRVREVQQPGFTQTSVNPAPIFTVSGANVTGVSFGNFRLVTIGGTKFQDTNGSGIRDAGEPGLQGFTIYIDANSNNLFDTGEISAVSDVNGNFTFTNLGPGSYNFREVLQPTFVKMTNNPATIVTTSGGSSTPVIFGNMPVANLFEVSKLALTGRNLTNYLDGTFARQANFVANLYETELGRAPDLNGLTYYLRLLMAGYTQTQVTALFRANNQLAA